MLAQIKKMPDTLKQQVTEYNENNEMYKDYDGNKLPKPYVIKQGHLCKESVKKDEEGGSYKEYQYISNTPPIINKRYRDIETGEVNYNLYFKDGDAGVNRPVTAIEITQKREMLGLARFALDINDKNAINLIEFVSLYLRDNKPTTQPVATRLGRIGKHFVHPLIENDVELFIHDEGYQSIADAFAVRGTLETYKENVFNSVKESPMVMILIYSSLGSIILHDMSVEPFITDLSGKTSAGKSTAQKVAASIWGNDYLVSEWNATKVSIERKASFLNSFPLFLDDTRKADKRVLNSIIYNHSGGRDKGRGNITSINSESTWENILISTGETSIADFSGDKAGVAARVVTLQERPFNDVDLTQLYEGLENNYGSLGLAFIGQYESDKEKYKKVFKQYEKEYISKAGTNEVMQRVGRPLALLQTVGCIVNDINGFEHDYKSIVSLSYESMLNNNKNIDKPKQLLESLLEMLDAHRNGIIGTEYGRAVSKEALAVFKPEYLNILAYTVRNFLGDETNSILKQWDEKDYLVKNKNELQKSTKINGTLYRGYAIKTSLLNELGYDFEIDDSD